MTARAQFRIEHVAQKPRGWRVRTKREGAHELRIAFPPGARQTGSGQLVEILHPKAERNPECQLAGKNPAELIIFGNPSRNPISKSEVDSAHDAYSAAVKANKPQKEIHKLWSRFRDLAECARATNPVKNPGWTIVKITQRGREQRFQGVWQSRQAAEEGMRRAQAEQPQARFEVREVNPAELIIFGNPSNSTHMRVGGVEGKVIETRGTKGSPEYLLETKDGKQVWMKPHYRPRTSNSGGAPNHKPGCDCQICENMKRAGARLPNRTGVDRGSWVHTAGRGEVYRVLERQGGPRAPRYLLEGPYPSKARVWTRTGQVYLAAAPNPHARLPNQHQRCDFRLSGGKCGKLASYVSADGKHHHCAEHASASDRSIYDRALPRRNPRVKLTPAQEKAWEFAFRMYIGEGKTDAQADRLAWRDLTLEFPELKKRKNPDGEMTQAVELFQTFHGKDPSGVIEKQVSAAMRLEYTALGDLDYLIVKPEGAGAVRIDFGGDGVKLASAPGGTQLYLIGGKQALDENCLEKFTDDTSKDLFDLGEAHEVQYIAKKAPHFDTVKYYHKFGEESKLSEMPRAFYDALRKQIFLAGGEYHVDAPGIIN